MPADVFKMLKDLEYKAVGMDPASKQVPEGFFVSFRPIGLPIPEEDYRNPWSPTGANLKATLASVPKPDAAPAPATTDAGEVTPVSASAQLDRNQIIAAGIGADMMAYLNTFMLTDDKLVMSEDYRVMPSAGKVNDTWYAIVNGANGIPSDLEVNDVIKKALADAKAVLMTADDAPTAHYEAYARYEEEYEDAVKERNRAYANAFSDPMMLQMWPIQGKIYQDDVDQAWDKWQGFGFKAEIERALAVLAAQGADPAILLIARAKHKYENSLVNIPNVGNIPYTFMSPNKWYGLNGDGWNWYTQSTFHSESHASGTNSRTSGSAGISAGFFTIGGGGSTSTERSNLDIKTENLNIDFEYTMVDIKRPWLDTTLLNLSNWFLVGDYPAACISDGTYGQQMKVDGKDEMLFLPSVVTSLVLVRNLKISFGDSDRHRDTFEKATGGSGRLGFGPFFIGGGHSEGEKRKNTSFNHNYEGLKIEGVQLIGYVSTIIPASPKKASKDYMQKIAPAPAQPVVQPVAAPVG